MSAWKILHRYRTPIDPDYGGPTSTLTLWLDNLGGLVLGMDIQDGKKVAVLPLPEEVAEDLAIALHARSERLDSFDVPPPVPVASLDGLPWDFDD